MTEDSTVVKLQIVVLNYQRPRETLALLDSVEAAELPTNSNILVRVIDNHSHDASYETITNWIQGRALQNERSNGANHAQYSCILSSVNGGYGNGNNLGIRAALDDGADLIWVLNNDAEIERDALVEIVYFYRNNRNVGLFGTAVVDSGDPRIVQSMGGSTFSKVFGRSRQPLEGTKYLESVDLPLPYIDYVSGCSLAMTSSAASALGGFATDHFLYYEEADLCWRARQYKIEISIAKSVVVRHAGGATTGSSRSSRSLTTEFHSNRSAVLFYWRHRRRRFLPVIAARVVRSLLQARKDIGATQAGLAGVADGIRSLMFANRILIVMHVDWRWPKQRPHFVAEGLQAAGYKILVLYLPSKKHFRLGVNKSDVRRLPALGLGRWSRKHAYRLNRIFLRPQLWLVASIFRPRFLLISHPGLWDAVPKRLRKCSVVYDCMDLAQSFTTSTSEASRILATEDELLDAAQVVFASSRNIAYDLSNRASMTLREPPVLVRNGHSIRPNLSIEHETPSNQLHGIYFGTLAEWLDVDALVALLGSNTNLSIELIGPTSIFLPVVDRLTHRPSMDHSDLLKYCKCADFFIMPFRVTPLIRGVDPVKLYEYLSFGVPVVCVWYEELEQFRGLVNFYNSADELRTEVRNIQRDYAGSCPDREAVSIFLKASLWEQRCGVMVSTLESVALSKLSTTGPQSSLARNPAR